MKPVLRFSVLWQGALVAMSLSSVDVGRANPAPDTPQPPPPDESTTLWLKGDAAADAGHLGEAVEFWGKAWDKRPNTYRLACKIGRAELRRGNEIDASTWLSRCRDLSPNATTPREIELAKEHTLELLTALSKVSTVTFECDEPDAHIVINDKIVRITPVLEDVFLEPGEQRIQVYKGLRTYSMTLKTEASKGYRVPVNLPPPVLQVAFGPPLTMPLHVDWSKIPLPPPREFRWWPVGIGGALAGTGLTTGLGLFIYSGVMDGTATNTLNAIQAGGKSCDTAPADPRCASYNEYAARSKTFSTAAVATFIATGAVTAGLIAYIIYENHRVSVEATLEGAVAKVQY